MTDRVGPCAEPLESRMLLARMGPEPFFDLWASDYGAEKRQPSGQLASSAAPSAAQASSTDQFFPLSDVLESEPNDTPASATGVSVGSSPNILGGAVSSASDVDFYAFTLPQRSGVFFDIEAFESGLSTNLDSVVTLYDAAGSSVISANDDGRDFDGFVLNDIAGTAMTRDSTLYADLPAGTYLIRVSSFGASTGSYHLKVYADSTYAASVPVLQSNPGAANTLYLDLDGHSATDAWGTYAVSAFDLNANTSEWTPGERMAVENLWRVVADAFSPFDVNVTTSYAGSYSPDATAFRQVITSESPGLPGLPPDAQGAAIQGSYAAGGAGNKTGFTFAENFDYAVGLAGVSGDIMARAIEVANNAVQQFGHALGLNDYGGSFPQFNAFMHAPDFGLSRERWVSGMTSDAAGAPPSVFQDDIAVITRPANSITLRSDDHGNSRPAATALSAVGNNYTATGVIHQTTDVDVFRFAGSGVTSITLDIPEHLHRLDGEVRLYDATGTLLASAEDPGRLSASLRFEVAATGDYYVEVCSDGGAGEIGLYALRINTTLAGPGAGSIAGRVFRDAGFNNTFESGAGDAPLSGVIVFLDSDDDERLDDGETHTLTSDTGDFSFPGLSDGTYRVRQLPPAGYASNVEHSVVISGAAAHDDVHFGNWPTVYNGPASADSWTVRLKPGDATRIQVTETLGGGTPITYEAPHAIVPALTFNGGDGADSLGVESTPPLLAIELNGNNGSDQLVLPTGAAAVVAFYGGANSGIDSAFYHGSTDAETITATDVMISGGGNVITHDDLESVVIEALDGADTIRLLRGAIGTGVVINAGEGDDLVHIGEGDLDALPGDITVNGGGGADQLELHDQLNSIGDAYTLNATTVRREFFGAVTGLTYSAIEGLILNAQLANNVIGLDGTAPQTPVTVNGGGGDDVLHHNGSSSAVTFNGGLDPDDDDELRIHAGTFAFDSDAALSTANLTVRIDNGAAVNFNSSQRLAGLHLNGGVATVSADGSRLIDTRALSITAGRLDLKNNDMIVRNGTPGGWNGTAYTGIRGLVDSGRGDGTWNGHGIVTSISSGNLTTIGAASAAELFSLAPTGTAVWQGQVVNGTDILLKFTWGGDANLDGKVNIDDYGRIDGNVASSGSVFGWYNGDFNYDGKINIDDYGIIDGNVSGQTGTL